MKRAYSGSSADNNMEDDGILKKNRKELLSSETFDSSDSEEDKPWNGNADSDSEEIEQKNKDSPKDDMFASDNESQHDEVEKFFDKLLDPISISPHNTNENVTGSEEPIYEDGIEIEAFNLEEESRNGVFDKAGNYTRRPDEKDDDDLQDQWLDEYKDGAKLEEVKQAQEERSRRQESLKRSKFGVLYTLEEALKRLFFFLIGEETVLDSLGRLNKYRSNYQKSLKQIKRSAMEAGPQATLDRLKSSHTVNAITFVTDLLDVIEKKGISDVYELTRAKTGALIKEESLDGQQFDDYKDKIWCFKWLNDLDTNNQASLYKLRNAVLETGLLSG